jgi:hypothetical protein
MIASGTIKLSLKKSLLRAIAIYQGTARLIEISRSDGANLKSLLPES